MAANQNGERYVTFKDLNGYLLWVLGGMFAVVVVIVSATAYLHHNMVTREEFASHVIQQNRWQDRMDSRMDSISRPMSLEIGDGQTQIVMVMSPEVVAEILRDERIKQRIVSNRESQDAMQ